MVRRLQPTTFQERLEILERATAGQSDSEIAATLQCSIWTVRKWRRIGQRQGRAGLTPPLGRPPTGPLGSVAPALRDAILALRRSHPGWGPDTILAELRNDPGWAEHPLPSRARIAALFKHAKLTRRYNRHTELPEPVASPEGRPHDEWELDAQGPVLVENLGKVCLVNVIDTTSRFTVESYPSIGTTNPPLETYQLVLRRAFLTTGLPRRLSFDRGTVFFDNTTTSPFPTRLHLWLLGLGVEVSFTRVRRPTDHAQVERVHQTMTLQALLGQSWPDPVALWAGLDARRTMLNEHIPAYYHLVLPHASLATAALAPTPSRGSGSTRRWLPVTPAMAAGITDHVWTTSELLSYGVPADFLDQLPELEQLFPSIAV